MDEICAKIPKDSVILSLGDFNCKIGSVTDDGVGDLSAACEDIVRVLSDRWKLVVSTTWKDYHEGDSITFSHKGSRIDFIAVGQECQGGIVRSFVAYDWGLLNGDRGHHLVVVDMDITFNAGQPPGYVKKALYDRDKARAYKKTGLGDVLSNLPQQAWRCDMNEHWQWMALRYHLQTEVAF